MPRLAPEVKAVRKALREIQRAVNRGDIEPVETKIEDGTTCQHQIAPDTYCKHRVVFWAVGKNAEPRCIEHIMEVAKPRRSVP